MGLIGKIGGQPDFKGWEPGGLPFGAWVTAVIAFVDPRRHRLLPHREAVHRRPRALLPQPGAGTPEDVELLRQIRDLLASQRGGTHSAGTTTPTP